MPWCKWSKCKNPSWHYDNTRVNAERVSSLSHQGTIGVLWPQEWSWQHNINGMDHRDIPLPNNSETSSGWWLGQYKSVVSMDLSIWDNFVVLWFWRPWLSRWHGHMLIWLGTGQLDLEYSRKKRKRKMLNAAVTRVSRTRRWGSWKGFQRHARSLP